MRKVTDVYLRSLKGEEKMREILIDPCLYLRVTLRKDGQTKKKWFIRYYDEQRQYRYTIGEYPEVGLAEARNRAQALRKKAVPGVSLAEQSKQKKLAQTFGDFCDEWIEMKKESWVDGHTLRQRERLGTVNRVFGKKDVNEVSMDDIIAVIGQKTQAGNYETAKRTLSLIRQVLEYADTLGHLADNRILIRIDSFRKTLSAPRHERHIYQELSDAEIGKLLADIDAYSTVCKAETGAALRLAPYLIARPKELCCARWDEIDFGSAEWVLPAERMKMEREHIVPLPTQVVTLIGELKSITGNHKYVFPSYSKTKPHIGTEALIRVFRRMGYVSYLQNEGTFFTTHGFRGMASTLLYQKLQFPGHPIELQLAHIDDNKVRTAYNRIHPHSWLDERRKMLQSYADYLDNLKNAELERRFGE